MLNQVFIVKLLASLADLKRHAHHTGADGGVVPDGDRRLGRLGKDLEVGIAEEDPTVSIPFQWPARRRFITKSTDARG